MDFRRERLLSLKDAGLGYHLEVEKGHMDVERKVPIIDLVLAYCLLAYLLPFLPLFVLAIDYL